MKEDARFLETCARSVYPPVMLSSRKSGCCKRRNSTALPLNSCVYSIQTFWKRASPAGKRCARKFLENAHLLSFKLSCFAPKSVLTTLASDAGTRPFFQFQQVLPA